MSATASLLEVFSQLEDPRKPRGVRHPFLGIGIGICALLISPLAAQVFKLGAV